MYEFLQIFKIKFAFMATETLQKPHEINKTSLVLDITSLRLDYFFDKNKIDRQYSNLINAR